MPAALEDSKLEFTVKWLDALDPPAEGQRMYWDLIVPAFGLRIAAGGAKTWLVQRGVMTFDPAQEKIVRKVKRFTLGRYPALSLAEARKAARDTLQQLAEGKDPALEQERRRDAQLRELAATFGRIRDRFLTEYAEGKKADRRTDRLRARTRNEYRRVLTTKPFAKWENRPIAEITFHRVEEVLAHVAQHNGGYAANRVHAYLRKFFNWCLAKRLIDANPMHKMARPAEEVERDYYFTELDLFALHPSLSASPTFAPIMGLLLLTGQRREEVGGMQWQELENLDGAKPIWRIPASRAKNGREHIVPLTAAAIALLPSARKKTGFVFSTTGETAPSGYSKCKTAIVGDLTKRKAALSCGALDAWRIHDFRRTVATHMGELGIPIDVIEGTLNHISGSRKGIVATYNRSQLLDDRRAAITVWSMFLQRVVKDEHTHDDVEALRRECRREYLRLLTAEDEAATGAVQLRLVA